MVSKEAGTVTVTTIITGQRASSAEIPPSTGRDAIRVSREIFYSINQVPDRITDAT